MKGNTLIHNLQVKKKSVLHETCHLMSPETTGLIVYQHTCAFNTVQHLNKLLFPLLILIYKTILYSIEV